jgi:predicted restriction endonuclease
VKDEVEKKLRGYREKKSIVRPDGREILVGRDWKKRKQELVKRCEGRCEYMISDTERCRAAAVDPHHIKERSDSRDDRLDNLQGLCRPHHNLVDWKKLHWTR